MHMKLHPMFANVYCIHDNNSQYMLSVPVMACTFQTHLRHRTQLPKFSYFFDAVKRTGQTIETCRKGAWVPEGCRTFFRDMTL